LDTIIPESQNIVLSDLDQMGTLVKKKLVSEKDFLDVYWNTVISSYEVLKGENKTSLYVNFKDLYNMACKYRVTNTPLEKDIFGPNSPRIEYQKGIS
jgi:hypothetical protein